MWCNRHVACFCGQSTLMVVYHRRRVYSEYEKNFHRTRNKVLVSQALGNPVHSYDGSTHAFQPVYRSITWFEVLDLLLRAMEPLDWCNSWRIPFLLHLLCCSGVCCCSQHKQPGHPLPQFISLCHRDPMKISSFILSRLVPIRTRNLP